MMRLPFGGFSPTFSDFMRLTALARAVRITADSVMSTKMAAKQTAVSTTESTSTRMA